MIATTTTCPRCKRTAKTSSKNPLCNACQAAIRQQATDEQERHSLQRWLSSRADAKGHPLTDSALTVYPYQQREIARLVQLARRLKVAWWGDLPAPEDFTARLARLTRESVPVAARNNARTRGRPAKVSMAAMGKGALWASA